MPDTNPITSELIDEITLLRARLAMLEQQLESTSETEAALRESRVRLRSVVAHTPIVLFALDREGIITLSEGKGLESLGLKPGQVVGDSIFEMYKDYPDIIESLHRTLAGESFTASADVEGIVFETRFTSLRDKQGNPDGAIGVATEITQRVRAERALRTSEERFRLLAENIPGVVYLCQNDERYTMLVLNDAVERLTGYPKEMFLDDEISFVDLYHPDDAEKIGPLVDEALAERRPFHLLYRLKHHDGHWVWIEEDGVGVFRDNELAFLEGYMSDVTKRVEAEQALREAHDRLELRVEERTEELSRTNRGLSIEIAKRTETEEALRRERDLIQTLIDHMPDYVFVKDRQCRFVTANEAKLGNLGVKDLSEIKGKTDLDFSIPELAKKYMLDDLRVMKENVPLINIDEDSVDPDGERRHLLTTKVPLTDGDGELIGLVGIARDVTDLRNAQEMSTSAQNTLAHVLRVATVSEMASRLAHELNNPLSAITNFIGGCERRMADGRLTEDDLREVLSLVAAQADRASEIVKTIRRHVNPRDVKTETLQLNDMAREAIFLVTSDVRDSDTTVYFDLEIDLPSIAANRVQIEQVIVNLTLNAIDAMKQANCSDRQLTIRTRTSDDHVEFVIADTGPGFPTDALESSFEPFVSRKPSGLGMGLSISRTIIEAHRGRLWATSAMTDSNDDNTKQGSGAIVRFRLPIQRGEL